MFALPSIVAEIHAARSSPRGFCTLIRSERGRASSWCPGACAPIQCTRLYTLVGQVHTHALSITRILKLSTPVHCRFLLCVKRATTLTYPSPPRLSDCLPANLQARWCSLCVEHVDTCNEFGRFRGPKGCSDYAGARIESPFLHAFAHARVEHRADCRRGDELDFSHGKSMLQNMGTAIRRLLQVPQREGRNVPLCTWTGGVVRR